MTAKKNLRILSLALFIAIAVPASATSIVPEPSQTASNAKTESLRGQQLMQRLEEIKAMDKSELTRLEKKSLRKEVTAIKKEMKAVSGGVYLSVGAIIIVILLLILLL
jgi:Skp family chaperone for outer membrane proteins